MLSVQTAMKMQHTLADSRFVEVPRAGHLVQGDNPVAFEQVVREFLGV
jgi:pimeloyl-ACP methyl ester carboxylesterase